MFRAIRRLVRFLRRLVLAVAIAVVVVVGAAAAWLSQSLPRVEGEVILAGPASPITIERDDYGIPTIRAGSETDAAFAMGYVHAQDRLWQMELMRRVGAGRIAEVLGPLGVGIDRVARTLRLADRARSDFGGLPADTKAVLQAYAAGVNGWLQSRDAVLPVEFLVAAHSPEPWTPTDSLLWQKVMSLQLSGNWRDEFLRLRLSQRMSPEQMRELWPDLEDPGPATMGDAGAHMPFPADALRALVDRIPEPFQPRLASNAWLLAGDRSESGGALLANDPHLGLSLPTTWYLARVVLPDRTLIGATSPGVPFLVIGHNGHVAWGFTTTHADTVDLVRERVSGSTAYLTPEGTEPFVVESDVIPVRFWFDEEIQIRYSRNGPIISDLLGDDPRGLGTDEVLALRAAGLEWDDRTAAALHGMNRATDWPSFREALRDYHSPIQNIFAADTNETIAFMAAGRIPIRADGDGSLPALGWGTAEVWSGWIPFEDLPQVENPPNGVIANANNRIVGDDYPHVITADWPEPYRIERILEVLAERDQHTLESMAEIQLDTRSRMVAEVLPLLLGRLQPTTEPVRAAAIRLLQGWNSDMARAASAPLLFVTWTGMLQERIFADELGDDFDDWRGLRPKTLIHVLEDAPAWCDNTGTSRRETCEDQIADALDAATALLRAEYGDDMMAWRWDAAHQARFRHTPLGFVPGIGLLVNRHAPTGGGDYTVNRGTFANAGGARFPHVHGPGLRALIDMADPAASQFIIATGQSGNPLSRHFDDMIDLWRQGRRVTFQREAVSVLTLTPGP